jgi:hypothetical protein
MSRDASVQMEWKYLHQRRHVSPSSHQSPIHLPFTIPRKPTPEGQSNHSSMRNVSAEDKKSNSDNNSSRPPLSPFTSYPHSKNILHGCIDAKTMRFRCYVKIASPRTSLGMVVNFARHIIFRWRGPTLDAELRIHITHGHCQGIASHFVLSRRE